MGRRDASGEGYEDVRVRLLGGFRVSVGERTVEEDDWRLRKAASLVKMLALAKDHRLHRERAIDLLWPDLDEEAQANNLRQALHVARRALEPAAPASVPRFLNLRDERLALCPDGPLWVDAEAFEEAAVGARRSREPSAYRVALDLYAGDLLPGDPYEIWTEERREGLRRMYLSLLVGLGELYEKRGEYGSAVEVLRRATAEEPAHEEAHAGLMRAYALSGRRSEALDQYGRLEKVLDRELAGEPGASVRRLHEQVLAGRFPPAGSWDGSPPERPSVPPRHNLPADRSSFVGREREALEVKRELAMTRLLTLAGAGGSGKTRLALAVAGDLAGAYPDGAWLVGLAPLPDESLVPQAAAAALGVREQPGRSISATLADHLRIKKALLVLDNCEHVIEAAARLADGLLSACPDLSLLATSREALRVGGEVVWQVPSLSVPEEPRGAPPSVEELGRSEAVRLFVERARSRRPGFELARAAGAVAEICRRLDGMPLAIELAAARMAVLSAEQMAARLDDSLGLLRGGARVAERRHQTLRAALDWSYGLLSEPEKELLNRLSVFAGGWTLEAAEAVGAREGAEESVLDLLEQLVDKSLVVAESTAPARYRLLEPVRQYAREKLEESKEARETHHRHVGWYLDLAEEAEKELTGPDYQAWLRRLEVEHDNLRGALGWSLEGAAPELGLRLAAALWLFWYTHGHLAEGRGWLEKALAATAR